MGYHIMKKLLYCLLAVQIFCLCACSPKHEQSEFPIYSFSNGKRGKQIGLLIPVENSGVLKMFVSVDKIKPGFYTFYLHDNPACQCSQDDPFADIIETKFPQLDASDGTIKMIIISPHLKMDDIRNRSLIIHDGAPEDIEENTEANSAEELKNASSLPSGQNIACVKIPQKKKR